MLFWLWKTDSFGECEKIHPTHETKTLGWENPSALGCTWWFQALCNTSRVSIFLSVNIAKMQCLSYQSFQFGCIGAHVRMRSIPLLGISTWNSTRRCLYANGKPFFMLVFSPFLCDSCARKKPLKKNKFQTLWGSLRRYKNSGLENLCTYIYIYVYMYMYYT